MSAERPPRLAPDSATLLWNRYRATSDPVARAQLLDDNLGLVHHAAHEVARRGSRAIELDELVSAGTIGLVQALEGFDPGRGQAFSSYAMPRIRGAILDELRAQDWRSRGGRTRTRSLDRARAKLEQKLGRRPEPAELAAALGVDLETYWRWESESGTGPPVRLEIVARPGESAGGGIADAIADPAAESPDDSLARDQSLQAMRQAFVDLPEKDRLVLAFSFEEGMTLREIAQLLHVTESRVSQIRTRALSRLRTTLHQGEEAA